MNLGIRQQFETFMGTFSTVNEELVLTGVIFNTGVIAVDGNIGPANTELTARGNQHNS